FQQGRYWELKQGDLRIITQNVPEVEMAIPVLFGGGGTDNTVYKDKSGSFRTKGINEYFFKIEPMKILEGRFINRIDVSEGRKVCVIGEKVYNDLFSNSPKTLGEYVRVDGIYFQVIGVVKATTMININGSTDEAVFIPISTMQRAYGKGDEVHLIGVTARENKSITDVEEKIGRLIRDSHSIHPEDKSALWMMNIEKEFQKINLLFLGISTLIWIVGMGSLAAGVIGVSNIMVVTVQERTKEIGIRRALGAKPVEVIMQIVQETVVLTVIAGLLGLTAGVGILGLAGRILEASQSDSVFFKDPQITFQVAIVASVILIICGIFAGLVPANRALQIKAIDAIREE
ncbi:MAG: ABC transporter permease, partial [Bacteroidales bacterium]